MFTRVAKPVVEDGKAVFHRRIARHPTRSSQPAAGFEIGSVDEKFEQVVKSAQDAAVLVLIY